MIKDSKALADVRASWQAAKEARSIVQANITFSFGLGGITTEAFRELCYSLTVIFAYSVLDDALRQLRDEGVFKSSRSQLGDLMHASRTVLPWVDFALIDAGRAARNKAAHERFAIPIPDTWKYVDAIEAELTAWGVL